MAFGVTALADLQAGAQVNFVELPSRRLARAPAVGPVGGNEGGDGDHAGAGIKRRHLADTADVFGPVLGRKPQIRIEPEAEVVAVHDEDLLALIEQHVLQVERQGRFSRPRQAGEPQDAAFVTLAARPVLFRDAVFYRLDMF